MPIHGRPERVRSLPRIWRQLMAVPARRPSTRTISTGHTTAGWDAADEPDAARARELWSARLPVRGNQPRRAP